MASDDPNYNVAAALFESASGWLRKKGRVEMMGPIDYSTNYVCGLLIDGFQFPPTILTAHNPPYYARLIESCGFTKANDGTRGGFPNIHPSRAAAQNCARTRRQIAYQDPTD